MVGALRLLGICLLALPLAAQTFVTPMMGGGQVAADMVHIDIYYDAGANQLQATVDDSYGTPELRPLPLDCAFDPEQPYGVLNGTAYNAQYGWNVGGQYAIPAGAAIWIERTASSPGLAAYSGYGRFGSYTPIFGTDGSPRLWKWSGVMVHNTYAFFRPGADRYFAEYHIFFGDAITGSREGFTSLGDTTVRLEWAATPVADPLTFNFGAVAETNDAPLCFLNADQFVTNTMTVLNFHATNAGPWSSQYVCSLPMLVVPATLAHGGPVVNHARLGSKLELQLVSLVGPRGGTLQCWEPGQDQPAFSLPVGASSATNRIALSQNQGEPGADPYGFIPGRQFALSRPGLYSLGFRVVDTSTNGLAGQPIHSASERYDVYLQAGFAIACLSRDLTSTAAFFGGESGRSFYLESASALDPPVSWSTVAGPLRGTNCLQSLTDPAPGGTRFYRIRSQ